MKTAIPSDPEANSNRTETSNSDLRSELTEISREAQIDTIIQENRSRLEHYVLESDYDYDIGNIPEEVLLALVPRKIYERSINPRNIQVKKVILPGDEDTIGPHEIEILIFEQPYPRKVRNKGKFGILENMHKLVGANVRMYSHLSASNYSHKKALDIISFEDNTGMQGEGLTADFYENLNEVARELGFVYIWGTNDEDNIDFFLGRLGRKRIKDMPQSEYTTYFKRELFTNVVGNVGEYNTYIDLREVK